MRGAIVEYMRRSGLVAQSIEAALPELPRWEGRLRKKGIEAAPRYPGQGPARAENELNLLIRQSRARDAAHRAPAAQPHRGSAAKAVSRRPSGPVSGLNQPPSDSLMGGRLCMVRPLPETVGGRQLALAYSSSASPRFLRRRRTMKTTGSFLI